MTALLLIVGCSEKADTKALEERVSQLDSQIKTLEIEIAGLKILADKTPGEVKAEQALRDQVAYLSEAIKGSGAAAWHCTASQPWKPCPTCPTNAITQCFRTSERCEQMATGEDQGCVLAPFAWCHDGEATLGMCYFSRDYCDAIAKVGNAKGLGFGTCKRVRP